MGQIKVQGAAEDDPVDHPMTNHQDIVAVLLTENILKTGQDPSGKLANAFSLPRGSEVQEIGLAASHCLRKTLSDFREGEAFPCSKIDFSQFGQDQERHVVMACYDPGAHDGSLQVTGVDGVDIGEAQALGIVFRLKDPHFRQVCISVAVCGKAFVTHNLTMPYQVDSVHSFHEEGS